jgi:hypothetical protein
VRPTFSCACFDAFCRRRDLFVFCHVRRPSIRQVCRRSSQCGVRDPRWSPTFPPLLSRRSCRPTTAVTSWSSHMTGRCTCSHSLTQYPPLSPPFPALALATPDRAMARHTCAAGACVCGGRGFGCGRLPRLDARVPALVPEAACAASAGAPRCRVCDADIMFIPRGRGYRFRWGYRVEWEAMRGVIPDAGALGAPAIEG